MFDKQAAIDALMKNLKDITDEEITELLKIPEQFLPVIESTTDDGFHTITSADLIAEQVRRDQANRPTEAQVVAAAVDAISLQQIINLGVGLYPLIDKISRYTLREELKRREAKFNDLFGRWQAK